MPFREQRSGSSSSSRSCSTQAEERVAVEVGFTDQPYWESGEKTMVGFFVASPGAPVSVPEVGLEIAVLDVASFH